MNSSRSFIGIALSCATLAATGCEQARRVTDPTSTARPAFASTLTDSIRDVPALQIVLPHALRAFDTSNAALEATVHAAGGFAFVAFKSPTAPRTFEAVGHRAAIGAADLLRALTRLSQLDAQALAFYRLSGIAYARLGPGVASALRSDSTVDWVEPALAPALQAGGGSPLPPISMATRARRLERLQTMPWNMSLVSAPAAWSLSTGASAKVMIMSGGVGNDPDLPTIPSTNCGGYFNSCGDSVLWYDGTMIAGLLYARDSTYSIVGVAPGVPGSRIYSWSFWASYGAGNYAMEINGLDNGATRGVRTVLLDFIHTDFNASEQTSIEAAINANMTIVAEVGILGQWDSTIYPASYPNVIGVSGVGPSGSFAGAGTCPVWATGSDYGQMVDIAAPISGVATFGNGLYYDLWWLGPECHTKLAAAHVAGAAALLNDLHPTWTPGQIAQALMASASGGGTRIDDRYGYGLLNVAAAVGYIPPPLTATISGPLRIKPNTLCRWWANPSGGTPPYTYTWIPPGSQQDNAVVESFQQPGPAYLTAWVYDAANHSVMVKDTITVTSSALACRT